MDGTKTIRLYTLDGSCDPVPCDNQQAHAAWMGDQSNTTILETKLAGQRKYVRTVFLGQNLGTDDAPVFFDVRIDPLAVRVNVVMESVPTIYAQCATWTDALLLHDKAIAYVRRMGQ